ncbi:MAG: hypothetical protein ACOX1P_16565 [Thermoguttaceae bacterium]|jgi:hypothetical protein
MSTTEIVVDEGHNRRLRGGSARLGRQYPEGWQKIGWIFRVIRGRRRLIRRIVGRVDIWVFISPVVASIKGFT